MLLTSKNGKAFFLPLQLPTKEACLLICYAFSCFLKSQSLSRCFPAFNLHFFCKLSHLFSYFPEAVSFLQISPQLPRIQVYIFQIVAFVIMPAMLSSKSLAPHSASLNVNSVPHPIKPLSYYRSSKRCVIIYLECIITLKI